MNFVSRPRGYCNHGMYGGDCMACSHMGEVSPSPVAPVKLNLIPLGVLVAALAWYFLKGKR